MILARLTGGFGNQLFQYAFAKAVANRLHTELVLDTSLLGKSNEDDQVVLRYFDLDLIQVKERLATEREVRQFSNVSSSGAVDKIKLKLALKTGRINWFVQNGHQLEVKRSLTIKDNTAIVGRFQSEHFFEDAYDEVKSSLLPSNIPVNQRTKELYKSLEGKTKIVLHIRRGDYVTHPTFSKTIGALAISYYEDALQHVKNQLDKEEEVAVLIVSDDIVWCKENLSHLNGVIVDQEKSKIGFASDFWLLTQADYLIISNSTFSWWGGWLAEAHGKCKMICAPAIWSRMPSGTPEGVLPERWQKIKNSFEPLQ